LSASDLLIWGVVLHLIADWPLQNDWMAKYKSLRCPIPGLWYVRHPAAYVHAGVHCVLLALIFGWVAIPLAIVHLIIDTRVPVVWWSKLVRQTQPKNRIFYQRSDLVSNEIHEIPVYDIGLEVRFWTDQVFHIACVAIAALLVTL
jgi:Protein of unknown function (DUF3307)